MPVLRVVESWKNGCVLSDGRELFVRYEPMAIICEQVKQDQEPVTVRTAMARIKPRDTQQVEELFEIHRVNRAPLATPRSTDAEVF